MVETLYVTKMICGCLEHTFGNGKATKDFNIERVLSLNGMKYIITEIVYEVEETEMQCVITTTYIVEVVK